MRRALLLLPPLCVPACIDTLSLRDNHCSNQDGDAWCRERDPARPFCARILDDELEACGERTHSDGCFPERPADQCYVPCGCGESNDPDGTCDGFAEGNRECLDETADGGSSSGDGSGSSAGSSTTGSGSDDTGNPTTGVPACMNDDDCSSEDAPFCSDQNECVTCDLVADGNAACETKFPSTPVCETQTCVQCTEAATAACTDTTPICDASANTCVACSFHEQCSDTACHIAEGSCFPNTVLHVDGDSDAPAEYFATIDEALASTAEPQVVIVLHEKTDDPPFYGELDLNDGRTVAILAAPGEAPALQGSGAPGLSVSASSTLYLQGVSLRQGDDLGLEIDGATAYVDRSSIVQNSGGGISIENGAELVLRNSFVGGDVNDVAAFSSTNSTFTIIYSSLGGGFGDAVALSCNTGTGSSVRNSILVTRGNLDELACTGIDASANALEMDLAGNTSVGEMETSWFESYNGGDFSLLAAGASIFANIAVWEQGDPLTDIDGEPRPTSDGDMDYAGADAP